MKVGSPLLRYCANAKELGTRLSCPVNFAASGRNLELRTQFAEVHLGPADFGDGRIEIAAQRPAALESLDYLIATAAGLKSSLSLAKLPLAGCDFPRKDRCTSKSWSEAKFESSSAMNLPWKFQTCPGRIASQRRDLSAKHASFPLRTVKRAKVSGNQNLEIGQMLVSEAPAMKRLGRSAPPRARAERPDNRQFLRDAMLAIFEEGFRFATEELLLYASDWNALARDIEVPGANASRSSSSGARKRAARAAGWSPEACWYSAKQMVPHRRPR